MKFEVKPSRNNLVTMISTIIMIFVTCVVWIMLKEYLYFGIFMGLTLIVMYFYFVTSYELKEDHLVVKVGFIPFKFKYSNIKKVEVLPDKVKLSMKLFNLELYPKDKDTFVNMLNKKVK